MKQPFKPLHLAYLISFSLVLVILTDACEKEKPEIEEVVAQVGTRALTKNAVLSELPPGLDKMDSINWMRKFTQQWIENEVMYQYALSKGLLSQEEVIRKLEEIQRRYISALVEQDIAKSIDTRVSDQEIIMYFEDKKEEFISNRDLYHILFLHVPEKRDIRFVLNEFKSIADWPKVEATYNILNAPSTDSNGVIIDKKTISELIQTDRGYSRLKKNQWSTFDVSLPEQKNAICMIYVREAVKKDEQSPLVFVRDEIRNRIRISKQQSELKAKMDSIRKKIKINVRLSDL